MLLKDVRALLITVQLQLSLYEGCRQVYVSVNILILLILIELTTAISPRSLYI